MSSSKILVIEDNGRLRRFIVTSLEKEGFSVLQADSGQNAFSILRTELPDLILLDLRLGDYDGIEILKTIRRQDDVPVIIVSSINNQDIKIDGFNIGCDDYITKPFYIDELIVRVKRLLVRSEKTGNIKAPILEKIKSGPFSIDINTQTVIKGKKPLQMRQKLFNLFLYFIKNPDIIISYNQLYEKLWSSSAEFSENSLYVHIRHLRAAIEDNPSKPVYIKTVKNAGYIYSPDE
ncbi:MAG: response regulator transcription factor [Spirochaetales bacterium]|uniref:Response regulator transcription factor n=1 Tax=Candidatus Thalassospirochaeta sargassi TaxID=3119039 RepID=A0AAJ1MN52_9SPIO|nr:response regulator transcription factor [Spirochaetales bacterium]